MKLYNQFFWMFLVLVVLTITGCKSKNEKIVCGDRGGINLIRNQYALHVQLFNNVLDSISEEEANKRISNNTNSFKWIAGHTLDIQYNLATALDIADENPYTTKFSYGKLFDPEATDYPTLKKMQKDWNDLAPKIMEAMDKIPVTQLSADLPGIPFPNETMEGMLGFQMHHLAYEIGQLGLYRKFLGKDGMSYKVNFAENSEEKPASPVN